MRSISGRCFEVMFLSFRYYSRNSVIRKPIRVLNSRNNDSSISALRIADISPYEISSNSLNVKNYEESAIIEKPNQNVVPYKKLEKNDVRFTKIVGIIKDSKRREKSGKILLEGKRLINDGIKAGMQMKTLYFSREKDLMDIKLKNPKEIEVCKVLYKTLRLWSDLTTCPGVMAIFKRPSADDISINSQPTIPVTILCDNIREPGNLGSIIRNAAAAGCENILLTKGCVDPWEGKVLRTGCGGHFRIPIVNDIEWSQISNYIPSMSTIFVADNTVNIDEVSVDSDFINFDEFEEDGEEATQYITINEHNQPIRVDETFNSQAELEKFEDVKLPCYLYSCVKYPKKHIVLYIGGETHGVDARIVKLACEFGGKKIKIPLENEMDSLNSAYAMTIVLYEIKRQFSQLYTVKE